MPSSRCPAMASTDAVSARATTRGVASTGTSPVWSSMAVSASPTTSSTTADKPMRSDTGPTIDNPVGGLVIEEAVLQRTLQAALRMGGDFAEVFVEDRRSSSARLDDAKVEELVSGRERGAGIRVVRGETTGYAHTADLSESGLREAAEAASSAASDGEPGEARVIALQRRSVVAPHAVRILPETVEKARKAEVLVRADAAARAESGSIRQVSAT